MPDGWQHEALCRGTDPNKFFPEQGDSTREIKDFCRGCPVRQECLEYALEHKIDDGWWGGVSERERRRMRKRMRELGEVA